MAANQAVISARVLCRTSKTMALRTKPLAVLALLATILLVSAGVLGAAYLAREPAYEVWAIDQGGAGTLYVYEGAALVEGAALAVPKVVDLGADVAALCLAQTGTAPTRAHMLEFSPDGRVAIVAFVATGHVAFLDAATHAPIQCVGTGSQAHAATPSSDGTFVLVADQNGRKLHRILTDADGDGATYEGADDIRPDSPATLALFGTCRTPSGALCQDDNVNQTHTRPNTAPICPILDKSDRLAFVTLAGGGLFVVDVTQTPLRIVGEYDRLHVKPNGCGGVQKDDRIFINSGGGPGNAAVAELYAFDVAAFPTGPDAQANAPNTPAPKVVYADQDANPDTHGMALTRAGGGKHLWIVDRATNLVRVVDTATERLVGNFSLAGATSTDPAPDLIALSPKGTHAFVSLRGPCPLTANDPTALNAVGATPGVGVIKVEKSGLAGKLVGVAPVTNLNATAFDCASVGGVDATSEKADVHAIAVRKL